MPKIIKDARPKILEAAQELFALAPYAKVDTRQISTAAGIAAGTLYNYFPSKKDLFFAAFEKRWADSLARLENAVREVSNDADAIDVFLDAVNTEFVRNKRLGRTFFQLTLPEKVQRDEQFGEHKPDHVQQIAERLLHIFLNAVARYTGQSILTPYEDDLRRMVLVLHMAIPVMDNVYGDRPQDNARFLSRMMHAYLDTYLTSHPGDR